MCDKGILPAAPGCRKRRRELYTGAGLGGAGLRSSQTWRSHPCSPIPVGAAAVRTGGRPCEPVPACDTADGQSCIAAACAGHKGRGREEPGLSDPVQKRLGDRADLSCRALHGLPGQCSCLVRCSCDHFGRSRSSAAHLGLEPCIGLGRPGVDPACCCAKRCNSSAGSRAAASFSCCSVAAEEISLCHHAVNWASRRSSMGRGALPSGRGPSTNPHSRGLPAGRSWPLQASRCMALFWGHATNIHRCGTGEHLYSTTPSSAS